MTRPIEEEAAGASCWAAGKEQTPGIYLEELQVLIFYVNELRHVRLPGEKSRTASYFSGVIKRIQR